MNLSMISSFVQEGQELLCINIDFFLYFLRLIIDCDYLLQKK